MWLENIAIPQRLNYDSAINLDPSSRHTEPINTFFQQPLEQYFCSVTNERHLTRKR